jgi:hypothetical protein
MTGRFVDSHLSKLKRNSASPWLVELTAHFLPPRSDILTPLPAMGVPFDIDDVKGPIIDNPIQSMDGIKRLHPLELDRLTFVARSVSISILHGPRSN